MLGNYLMLNTGDIRDIFWRNPVLIFNVEHLGNLILFQFVCIIYLIIEKSATLKNRETNVYDFFELLGIFLFVISLLVQFLNKATVNMDIIY
jgi:hypothetical protein